MTIVAIARLLSSGFRPFFFLAAAWAALGVPVWLTAYVHGYAPRAALPPPRAHPANASILARA